MNKCTLKTIKDYIRLGIATDVTNYASEELPKCYNKICYSSGIYGINGGVYEDAEGNMYAITSRNSNLFRIF